MKFENTTTKESKEKSPRGQWAKALIALTNGALHAHQTKAPNGMSTLEHALGSAARTREVLEAFDPDNTVSGSIEGTARKSYETLREKFSE